jgi:hypothetical protein
MHHANSGTVVIPEHTTLLVGDGEQVIPGPPPDFEVNAEWSRLEEAGHVVLPPGFFTKEGWTDFYGTLLEIILGD